ncbi:SAM-dependent methyltransferase, partial [Thermococci archaeon]
VHRTIIKALDFVDEGGKLIIVEPFRENFENIAAWEFFEKLTKEFRRFPQKSEILDALSYYGKDAKVKEYGKSALVLEPIL